MKNIKEIFLLNDQPVTCPRCGNRTAFTEKLIDNLKIIQSHICLSNNCKFEFKCIEEI